MKRFAVVLGCLALVAISLVSSTPMAARAARTVAHRVGVRQTTRTARRTGRPPKMKGWKVVGHAVHDTHRPTRRRARHQPRRVARPSLAQRRSAGVFGRRGAPTRRPSGGRNGRAIARAASAPTVTPGPVMAWGGDGYNELGDRASATPNTDVKQPLPVRVPHLDSSFVQIVGGAAGDGYFVAVSTTGSAYSWGTGLEGALGRGYNDGYAEWGVGRIALNGVISAAAGSDHTLFLTTDGVYGTGDNYDGDLLPGHCCGYYDSPVKLPLTNVTAIAAGGYDSYVLKGDGTVWAFGDNHYGQLGQGDIGTRSAPVQIAGLTGIVAIAGGEFGGYALKSDGTVWSWGSAYHGSLGNASTTDTAVHTAAQIAGLTNVVALGTGPDSPDGYAIKADGTLWAWGDNEYGTVGDGTTVDTGTPKQVPGLSNVMSVSASDEFAEALTADGHVWSWGRNLQGGLGDGTYASHYKPAPVQALDGATAIGVTQFAQAAVANVGDPYSLPGGYSNGGDNPAGIGVPATAGHLVRNYDDLQTPGRGIPLAFARSYDSGMALADGRMGFGWSYSYGLSVTVDGGGNAVVKQENGSEAVFTPNGSGGWTAPKFVNATLVHNGDGTWTMVRQQRTTLTFDSSGRLSGEIDLNGYTTRIAWPDASTQTITDSAGRKYTATLSGGHIVKLQDGASPARTVVYGYDTDGNLTDVTDAGGGVTRFTYDAGHRIVNIRSPRFDGDTTASPSPIETIAYDDQNRVTSETDEVGDTTTYDYTSIPNAEEIVDPSGNATVNTYDNGQVVASTKGYGTSWAATWHYYYDATTDLQTGSCDPAGRCVTMIHDARGNLLSKTNGLGQVTKYTYDALDDQTSMTDPKGVTTTMTYDGSGNLLTKSTPLLDGSGNVSATQKTTYNYGGTTPVYAGDVTSTVDPNGKTWQYRYDAYGDLISRTAPATAENSGGNKTTWTYNTATGWKLSETSPRGNVAGATASQYTTSYSYDAFGRLIKTTDPLWSASAPLKHQQTTHYDADGNVDYTIDGNGQKTTRAYDPADRLIMTTRADGTTTKRSYNPDGSVATTTNGRGKVTVYAYDPLGHVTSITDPLNRVTAYTYGPTGLLTEKAAPGGSCYTGAACQTLTYDGAGQLLSSTWVDNVTPGVTSITYDADGQRTGMKDASGTSTWTWDSLGRLTSTKDGNNATVSYGYDLAGQQTSITYPGGTNKVTRDFDAAGRIDWIQDYKSNKTTFAYDADSNLVKATEPTAAGVTDTYVYDATERMASSVTAKGGTTLAGFTYTRDGIDDVATATTSGIADPAQTYSYNQLEQLTASGSSASPTTYSYDADGNMTRRGTSTLAYDDGDQLCWQSATTVSSPSCGTVPSGATSFAYDASGNRTKATPSAGAAKTYTYDEFNQLKNYNGVDSYVYDATGLRMSKTPTSGTKQSFAWDRTSSALLSDGTNNYVYGPDGSPLEQISSGGTVTFLHHDAIGSTRLLTSTAGANVGSYSYDPWGTVASHTGTVATSLQYTGGYTDAESGLVYLRARYYDPSTGQFINVDPVLQTTGEPYDYAGDNPVNNVDPTGLKWTVYVLKYKGVPYYVGRTSKPVKVRMAQHIKKGRFEQGNGFSYDVLATDIKDTAAARGAEETGILALGTLGKHVSVPGHPGALKNQRHEVSEQNPRRQEILSKGNKVMQDDFRGAMKLTNDAEQVREAESPLAQSDRNAIATESNADFIAGLESEAIEEGSRR